MGQGMTEVTTAIFLTSWHMLLQAAPYMLFGILAAGMLKVFLKPETVARHLSGGRFMPVFKAALLGIPLPLCSCGVLPAAATLKKEGANRGAVTSFLISTPESSVDSIAVTWALLDPVITVARPLAAFITAFAAGITVNFAGGRPEQEPDEGACSCEEGCCGSSQAEDNETADAEGFFSRVRQGISYAAGDVWGDISGWFFLGLVTAGVISVLLPEEVLTSYLGGGIGSMLVMLVAGIPMYICASASTPVAAALVLKGASPGTALVLMLAGPATNVASLTVLYGLLGKRAAAVYLLFIAVFSVAAGLALDFFYSGFGLSARAAAGNAGETVPYEVQFACAVILVLLSVPAMAGWIREKAGGIPRLS